MAYIGMKYPVYRVIEEYTPGSAITYVTGSGHFLDEAVSANVSENIADVHLNTNDRTRLWDNGLQDYTMELGVGDLPLEAYSKLLGYKEITSGGETPTVTAYRKTDKDAPEVSFGWLRNCQSENDEYYSEVWWFMRTKWNQNSNAFQTKDRQKEFATPTINGRGMEVEMADGTVAFFDYMRFDSGTRAANEAAAKAWLLDASRGNITES